MKYRIFLMVSSGLLLVSAVQAGEPAPSQMERSGIKVEWKKTFGGSGSDEGYSVSPTSDGGYIIIGRTES